MRPLKTPSKAMTSAPREKTTPHLSVVIPAFNEEARIGPTLDALVGYLDTQTYSREVVVVDDGSTDDTVGVVERRAARPETPVRVESMPHAGKGWAVRHGMLSSGGRYRFMCDADLAMPVRHLDDFLGRMDEGYDIVIGSRQIEGARRFGEGIARHFRGRVFNWVVRLVAVGGFQDTQCGFKCFRGEVAEELFSRQMTRGLGFDVEILYLATRRRLRVLEMPIDWHHQQMSRVGSVVEPFSMLRDALAVRIRAARGLYGSAAKPGDDGVR